VHTDLHLPKQGSAPLRNVIVMPFKGIVHSKMNIWSSLTPPSCCSKSVSCFMLNTNKDTLF